MEALVFGFASFVSYKAIAAIMFRESPTLVYCAVMAVITTAVVLVIGAYFNMRTRRLTLEWDASDKNTTVRSLLFSTFRLPIFVAITINVILGFLIVPGFSEEFSDDILSLYRFNYTDRIILFAVLLLIPPLSFFLFQAWRAHSALKDMGKI